MPVRIYTKLDFSGEDTQERNSRNRTLILTGESDERRIYSAIDDVTGATVPGLGSNHPVFTGLRLVARLPSRFRSDAWEIQLRYDGIDATGDVPVANNDVTFKWEEGQVTEQRDYDVYEKPLIDRAGFPIGNGFPFVTSPLFLRVWRNETTFDVPTSHSIRLHVNKVRIQLFGAWWVEKQQMMCWSYAPTEAQRLGNTAKIQTQYLFEFREGVRPFQPRWPNRGFNNWATGTEDGAIVYANGDPIKEPVNFTSDGAIVAQADRLLRIKKRNGNVVQPRGGTGGNPLVTAQTSFVSTDAGVHTTEPSSTSALTYVWTHPTWKMMAGTSAETILLSQDFYKEVDFRGLIPGIM